MGAPDGEPRSRFQLRASASDQALLLEKLGGKLTTEGELIAATRTHYSLRRQDPRLRPVVDRLDAEGVEPGPIDASTCAALNDRAYGFGPDGFAAGVMPSAGNTAIFFRSWYRRVLDDRILGHVEKKVIARAFDEINEFEAQQRDYGTLILKLYFDVSADVQEQRLAQRRPLLSRRPSRVTPMRYRSARPRYRACRRWGRLDRR